MGKTTRWRYLIYYLKDKASLIKASLSTKHNTSIHMAVILATTHDPSTPPPETIIAAILSSDDGSPAVACTCIDAVMDRLHHTHNVFVALKCLIILHKIIMQGSFILKDQLSFYPFTGGPNFLNLSRFRDSFDSETWELSSWVRWYADVIEQNLIACRVLGSFLCSSNLRIIYKNKKERASGLLRADLLPEIDALASFVEQVCESPNSLHLQKNNLVYEVVLLAAQNYRWVQHEMLIRVAEFGGRVNGLSLTELTQFLSTLKRLEDCKERLYLLFVNRQRNDAFWDLIRQTKIEVEMEKKKREESRLVIMGRREESSELTRYGERVLGSGQLFPFTPGGAWLEMDRVHWAVDAVQ